MTIVKSSALAIIVNSSVFVRVFQKTSSVPGSGWKAGSNGGSPEVRRLFQRQETVSWDVAVRGGESWSKGGCGAPRLGRCCAASARDLLSFGVYLDSHLNAWSSRK